MLSFLIFRTNLRFLFCNQFIWCRLGYFATAVRVRFLLVYLFRLLAGVGLSLWGASCLSGFYRCVFPHVRRLFELRHILGWFFPCWNLPASRISPLDPFFFLLLCLRWMISCLLCCYVLWLIPVLMFSLCFVDFSPFFGLSFMSVADSWWRLPPLTSVVFRCWCGSTPTCFCVFSPPPFTVFLFDTYPAHPFSLSEKFVIRFLLYVSATPPFSAMHSTRIFLCFASPSWFFFFWFSGRPLAIYFSPPVLLFFPSPQLCHATTTMGP